MALIAFFIVAGAASPALGRTDFTDALGDHNFNNTANWTNGLPLGNDEMGGNVGYIGNGTTATLTANRSTSGGGGASNTDIYVGTTGTAGTFNTGAFSIYYGASTQQGFHVGVWPGSVGMVNVNSGGVLDTGFGANPDLRIGRSDKAGTGTVTFLDGGRFGLRGGVRVYNGTLWFYAGSRWGTGGDDKPRWACIIQDTLKFSTNGTTINTFRLDPTHTGSVASLTLTTSSKLVMDLGGTFNVGHSWMVVQDYETLTGTFGSVIGTHGETFAVNYTADVPGTAVSGPNDIVVTLATIGGTTPTAPTNLSAQPGDGQVLLTWNPVSGPVNGYRIYQSQTSVSGYTQVSTATLPTQMVTGLTNGTRYYFVVTAFNAVGESPRSNEASATPQSGLCLGVRHWGAYP